MVGVVKMKDSVVRMLKFEGTKKPKLDVAIEALNALKLEKTSIKYSLLCTCNC